MVVSPPQKMINDLPLITADTALPEDEFLRTHVLNTRAMAKKSATISCQSRPLQTNLQACTMPFPTKFYSEGGQDRYILKNFFHNRLKQILN